MAYPTTISSFSQPNATAPANNPSVSGLMNQTTTDVVALETKIGTGAATPVSGYVMRGNGTGSSTWGQVVLTTDVTGTLPAANGGTGLTSLPLTVPLGGSGATTLTGILLGNGTAAFTTTTAPTGSIVGTSATQTLTNKTLTSPTLTTPTIASIVNSGTLSLPTATDTLVGRATTDTLTNKRITSRVASTTSSATPTPNTDSYDWYTLSAQAATAAFAVPSGTPTDAQALVVRIKDNGTARALTWSSATNGYVAGGVPLPSSTVTSKILHLGFVYNTANALNKWMLIALSQEA